MIARESVTENAVKGQNDTPAAQTRKLLRPCLSLSPMPPSRSPVHVSSSVMAATSKSSFTLFNLGASAILSVRASESLSDSEPQNSMTHKCGSHHTITFKLLKLLVCKNGLLLRLNPWSSLGCLLLGQEAFTIKYSSIYRGRKLIYAITTGRSNETCLQQHEP